MAVPLFARRPVRCPFGHSVARGLPQLVGWKPCMCAPAREDVGRGRGMGHLWIWCGACHDEGRDAVFYEPPHDVTYRARCPWRPPR